MGWLSRNNLTENDYLIADMLNSLANDDRLWGGDVNGGGHKLSNVILAGSGGFEFLPSPIQITPGAAGGSVIQADQTIPGSPDQQVARWVFGKDSTAEAGANTGSNYVIQRYSDAGTVLDTPFSIDRATGQISMRSQKWTGPIDGGGQTISNITVAGMVPDTRRVVAGAGLTGGGPLSADVTLAANVTSVFGRSGAVVLTTADISGASGVVTTGSYTDPAWLNISYGKLTGVPSSFPPSAHIHAAADVTSGVFATARLGTGTANGTTYLRGDGTWATVTAGSSGHVIQDEGTPLATRAALNFVGAGVTVTDDAANNCSVVTIPGGGGSGSQTPWAQDVDANGFALKTLAASNKDLIFSPNATERMRIDATGRVLIGTASALYPASLVNVNSDVSPGPTGDPAITVHGTTNRERIAIHSVGQVAVFQAFASGNTGGNPSATVIGSLGYMQFGGHDGASWVRTAWITANAEEAFDSTHRATNLVFSTTPSGSTTMTERMRITASGNCGINTASPFQNLAVGPVASLGSSGSKDASIGIATTKEIWATAGGNSGTYLKYVAGIGFVGVYDYGAGSSPLLKIQPDGGNVLIGSTITGNPSPRLETFGTGGAPATSGVSQAAGSLRISRAGGSNVLDMGSYTTPPFGCWLQVADYTALQVAYPLVLQPNGGNVGIGVTSPQARLHVFTPDADPSLVADAGTVANSGPSGVGLTAGVGLSYNAAWLQAKYMGNDGRKFPILLNPLGGNVGIGNSGTPYGSVAKPGLYVGNQASTDYGEITLCGNQTTNWQNIGLLNFANFSLGSADKRIAAISATTGNTSDSGQLVFFTWNAGAFGARMAIGEDGHICIGAPAQAIAGANIYVPSQNAFAASALLFQNKGAGDNQVANISLAPYSGNPQCAISLIGNSLSNFNGEISFSTGGSGFAERMRIANSGNVGIGLVNPAAKLQVVQGTAGVGFNVSGTDLPTAAGSTTLVSELSCYSGNGDYFRTHAVRTAAGSSWVNTAWRIGRFVDVSTINYIEFGAGPITISQGGAVRATFDGAGNLDITGTYKVNGVAIGGGSGITVQNSPAGRTQNVTYTNSTGKPMLVCATMQINGGVVWAQTDGSNPPSTVVAAVSNPSSSSPCPVSFWVMPGNYYRLAVQSGTGTVAFWTEWY